MDYDTTHAHPTNKTQSGNYPRPKCDPKKSIVHTTPAAVNPTMDPDPSVVYRGTRPHRPPPSLTKPPTQSPYPPKRLSTSPKQHQSQSLARPNSTTSNAPCPFISQPHTLPRRTPTTPPPRVARYPQHPHSQVRSVCSPAARINNPYAFSLRRATHTNH